MEYLQWSGGHLAKNKQTKKKTKIRNRLIHTIGVICIVERCGFGFDQVTVKHLNWGKYAAEA